MGILDDDREIVVSSVNGSGEVTKSILGETEADADEYRAKVRDIDHGIALAEDVARTNGTALDAGRTIDAEYIADSHEVDQLRDVRIVMTVEQAGLLADVVTHYRDNQLSHTDAERAVFVNTLLLALLEAQNAG